MEALLTPLDVARSAALRLFGRFGQRFLARRDERVLVVALLGLCTALAMTCAAPVLLFALGPIVLGTIHLASDVRYLVTKPGAHRRGWLAALTALPLAAMLVWPTPKVGLLAGFAPILFARAGTMKKAAMLGIYTALYALAWQHARHATLFFVHAHNVIAVLLFTMLFSRRRSLALVPTLLFVAISMAILAGAFDAWLLRPEALSGPKSALGIHAIVRSIAPGVDPILGVRIVAFFVFAQSVHYVVWLRLVPEDARERAGIRSFRASFRALEHDLGRPLLVITLLIGVGIAAYALLSLEAARRLYLHIASFHTYLEIAALVLVALEGGGALLPASARTSDLA